MNPDEYAIMDHAEEGHWWYVGMERITVALLDCWYAPGSNLRILDAGCGTGKAMTSYLTRYGQVTGFDFAPEAVRFSRQRGATRLAQASVMEIPFASHSFDLVVRFDVLCERGVPDDVQALREIRRVLVPGGRVLLRLPACNWLRGHHDAAVHIRHRYNKRDLVRRFRKAGLQSRAPIVCQHPALPPGRAQADGREDLALQGSSLRPDIQSWPPQRLVRENRRCGSTPRNWAGVALRAEPDRCWTHVTLR